ncbi:MULTISPECIES: DUF6286 domain-containing protein [Nocardiopsis]|uniref:DUF6286 domain-containing protein n=1 Tax=Nocardiopsis TaxID=2013 RepID=UPI0003789739|nr:MULTISPECIES: DUF6286 domain-containing protein [Nocardiopsis]ASU61058.1 hypothetical protein CGQ36_27420 [Nocardiopsis dassonvillei]
MTSLQEEARTHEASADPGGPPPGGRRGDRGARRTAVRVFRPRRTLPAVVVAASVTVVSGLVLAVITASMVGAPAPFPAVDGMAARAATVPWEAPETMLASGVAAALGLTLLTAASLPGYGGHLVLRTDDRDMAVGLSRRALRDLLAVSARGVDGVRGARVRVGRRTVRVRARTHIRGAHWLRRDVDAAVRGRLEELVPVRVPRVRVRVREEA